jgi:hypothetical protein
MSCELDKLAEVVNLNDGWFTVYSDIPHKVGDILPESYFPPGSPRCAVIGIATKSEAERECQFAQVPFMPAKHYYKAMAD